MFSVGEFEFLMFGVFYTDKNKDNTHTQTHDRSQLGFMAINGPPVAVFFIYFIVLVQVKVSCLKIVKFPARL